MKHAKRHHTASADRPNTQPRNSRGGTLLGLFIGLVLGMLIALGVAWYLRQAPLPFENKYQAPAGSPASPVPGGAATQAKPLPLPGKPGGETTKPRFDFYGILEGKQTTTTPGDVKPEGKLEGKPGAAALPPGAAPAATPGAAPSSPGATGAVKESLFLQVGAYQKTADADNMRAKLTLLGFEAEILEADIPDKGRMYRVRTGPYGSAEEMNKARTALAQNGIQAALVKIK